jgi:hypothetical protein
MLIAADAISSALAEVIARRLDKEGLSLGFTGPRREMTAEQRRSLGEVLRALPAILGAHHGDCVGADAEFHALCAALEIPVHLHPPAEAGNRSYCQGAASVAKEEGYLERNRAIVDAADILLAAPRSDREVQRSGIWATVRYARKAARLVLLILPDGGVLVEEGLPA